MTENIYVLVILGMSFSFLLALSLVFFYKRYQSKLLKQQIAAAGAELAHREALLHATIQSQEDERRRIGRDLHDGVGGMLSNLKMNIHRLNRSGAEQLPQLQQQCSSLIDKTMTNVRAISHSLSPPALELFGLAAALEELIDDINRNGLLRVVIENNAPELVKQLDANTALALYRILQELLANTIKHAQAVNVVISMEERQGNLQVQYTDDGRGCELDGNLPGMGMRNIQIRAGMTGAVLKMTSSPGSGFSANITLNDKKAVV
jgi:signal transduction histidine kinase